MGVSAITLIILAWMSVVHATWFPEMELSSAEWQAALQNFDVSSSYKTCNNEFKSGVAGDSKFIAVYKDQPMTFVVVGKGKGNMDVKFKDSTYVFEHDFELSDDSYLVIPPYQPVEWLLIRLGAKFSVCSYSGTSSPSQ
jgi:hypothetical protein